MEGMGSVIAIVVIVIFAVILIPVIISRFLTTVDAGTIRLVSRFGGSTSIFKGPGKAIEVPLLTTSTTIPSKAINIDLDIADQTADVDRNGTPKPIKVRVLASAIVSVGDSNEMITTAANKFFSKPQTEQTATLSDLLTSTGRRAVNLLNHDELFSSKGQRDVSALAPGSDVARSIAAVPCGRRRPAGADYQRRVFAGTCKTWGWSLTRSTSKKSSREVAEARRRQSAVEAKANADIVSADQERRAKEAQLAAEQAINDKQRDLEQRKAENAATVAEAEAKKQTRIGHSARGRTQRPRRSPRRQPMLPVFAFRPKPPPMRKPSKSAISVLAQADAIRAVNEAIQQGGDAYLALKQIELLPQIVPAIAEALAHAKLINISGAGDGRGAAGGATDQITGVIQTLLATQLVSGQLRLDNQDANGAAPVPVKSNGAEPPVQPAPEPGWVCQCEAAVKRILVLGSGGAGKSTLAQALGTRLDLPVIHLDAHYWQPGWTAPPPDVWERIVRGLVQRETWVMDGNFSGTMEIRLAAADTVVFLDFPRLLCLWRITRRFLKYRGQTRPDMAPGCVESLDWDFAKWVWDYPRRTRPLVLQALRRHAQGRQIIHLHSPNQVRGFLQTLPTNH